MTLVAGVIAPHPPILIPQIGGDHFAAVADTVDALKQVSEALDALEIDALVVVSPHSPLFEDTFIIRAEDRFHGDFEQFGAGEPKFSIANDTAAVEAITNECRASDVPLQAREGPRGPSLDWGVTVPYSYLGRGRPIVSISVSFLPHRDHWSLGEAISRGLAPIKKRYAFVASGDLSHRLTADAPNGYSPRGLEFDRLAARTIETGRLGDLLEMDGDLIESAGECGLRSFIALGGALSNLQVEAKVLSYEGPFGVGYMVAMISSMGGGVDDRSD